MSTYAYHIVFAVIFSLHLCAADNLYDGSYLDDNVSELIQIWSCPENFDSVPGWENVAQREPIKFETWDISPDYFYQQKNRKHTAHRAVQSEYFADQGTYTFEYFKQNYSAFTGHFGNNTAHYPDYNYAKQAKLSDPVTIINFNQDSNPLTFNCYAAIIENEPKRSKRKLEGKTRPIKKRRVVAPLPSDYIIKDKWDASPLIRAMLLSIQANQGGHFINRNNGEIFVENYKELMENIEVNYYQENWKIPAKDQLKDWFDGFPNKPKTNFTLRICNRRFNDYKKLL